MVSLSNGSAGSSRPNGQQTASANGNGHVHGEEQPYRVLEQPYEHRRPLKVVCIGAGFSGIYLALRMQQRCQNVELVIYEKNTDVGGTWFENTYPGVACDVPSHIYCYSFEPDASWQDHYAKGSDILGYLKRCARKFDALQYIRFQHKITSAVWNDDTAKWDFEIENAGSILSDSADVFINAGGFLNAWKWPDIKGLHDFKGDLLHTASWAKDFDYAGKNVAVIGSGSSALQVIPNVQSSVKHMDAYIRSATFIPLPLAHDYLEAEHCDKYAGDRKYSAVDQAKFADDPAYLLQYRKTIESGMNEGFKAFHKGNPINDVLRSDALANMKKLLAKKPELYDLLAPKWEFGCRRPSPGIGFLEALVADNVDVVKDEIECFTATGIRTADGKEREVDAIICATGFDVSWRPRFLMAGRGGFQLDAAWAQEPRSYLSIAIENMPNYFIFNGPYNCGGNGNAIPPIEVEGDYMIQCINKIQRHSIRSMTPQLGAIEDFAEHADTFMPRMTWAGGCRNWYRTRSGRVVGTYPASGVVFNHLLKNPRWEDFDYEYLRRPDSKANRFAFMGQGMTTEQIAGTADLSPYLNEPLPATLPSLVKAVQSDSPAHS